MTKMPHIAPSLLTGAIDHGSSRVEKIAAKLKEE